MSMLDPEAQVRQEKIDPMLKEAGWTLQRFANINLAASNEIAVAEVQTKTGKEVDYALFLDGVPVGIIEVKAGKYSDDLNKAEDQNDNYIAQGLKVGSYDCDALRFIYETNGEIIEFRDLKDPKPRSRKIFCFQRPETLRRLRDDFLKKGKTLRGELQSLPVLPTENLRDCQIDAINGLEKSLAQNNQRSLIQMATGAGKTFTAITAAYRFLKYTSAKRILFLVDTNNLGKQADGEFKRYKPFGEDEVLASQFKIVRLESSYINSDVEICITTIQRLYAMLKGCLQNLTKSDGDFHDTTQISYEVKYSAQYPPEFFDLVFIDECHRSIYNNWKQVVEYFDAFLVGLTATPADKTLAFFNQNLVSEYTHQQAVIDNVNVGEYDTYIIQTEASTSGGKIAFEACPSAPLGGTSPLHKAEIRHRKTRKEKWTYVDQDELDYKNTDLDKSVVKEDEIRKVFQEIKNNWNSWPFFCTREELPKTLVFAKDDSHADDIVRIAREVFCEGNAFCKKITYKCNYLTDEHGNYQKDSKGNYIEDTNEKEDKLLNDFRFSFYPRIAVTVSKIATGTDVKPIEILVFMRDVRSENLYEQMLGRGRRTLSEADLKRTSPSATSSKNGYVVVDAVGVTASKKTRNPRPASAPRPKLADLMQAIATGSIDSDLFEEVANRIARLNNAISSDDRKKFAQKAGVELKDLAKNILEVHNEDKIREEQMNRFGEINENNWKQIVRERAQKLAKQIFDPTIRTSICSLRSPDEQFLDKSADTVLVSNFDKSQKDVYAQVRTSFKEYIEQNKDRLTALSIIYNSDYKKRNLTEQSLRELADSLQKHNGQLSKVNIFGAYKEFTKNNVMLKYLTDLIPIVKYEYGISKQIIPFSETVSTNFQKWTFQKNRHKAGEKINPFSEEQMEWLRLIKEFIAMNGSMTLDAFNYGKFADKGGGVKYYRLFGNDYQTIIDELNLALVA